jgi:hypothetical protein
VANQQSNQITRMETFSMTHIGKTNRSLLKSLNGEQ